MQRTCLPILTTARGFRPGLIGESDISVADRAAGHDSVSAWRILSRSESQEWVTDSYPIGSVGHGDLLVPTINGVVRPSTPKKGSLEWLYVPNHLLHTVWELLSDGRANDELYRSFSDRLISYLSFKNVPTAPSARVDIVATSVGICSEPSLLRLIAAHASGAAPQLCVTVGRTGGVEPIICFNGGPTAIFLYAKVPPGENCRAGDSAPAVSADDAISDPGSVIRIRMEPGEGVMALNGFADWCLAGGELSTEIAAVVVATETSTENLTA